MKSFLTWFIENTIDSSIVVDIAKKARQEAGVKTSVFGDCRDVVGRTIKLLHQHGIPAHMGGSHFWSGEENGDFEHSWVVVDGHVLDPTIDQFFSDLDEDMLTSVDGIYYSHPEWDGDKYVRRYTH